MKKYFKHKIKSLLLVNKIVVIHYLELNEYFHHAQETHNFWEMVCAVKGDVICNANGNDVEVKEGFAYFHKPNESHSLTVSGEKHTGVFVISFECLSEAMRFFSDKKIKLNQRQIKFIKQIIEIAKRTYDITFYNLDTDIMNLLPQPTLGGEQLIKNYIEMLLIDIMRQITETKDGNDVFLQETEINNKLAQDVIDFLTQNIFANISIENVCKAVSYSKAYVFRQFKLATGKSVMEYYTDIKIVKAKEMIKTGNYTVKEISEKLCFDTPNYFTKKFKKIVNETPTEYKKRVAE